MDLAAVLARQAPLDLNPGERSERDVRHTGIDIIGDVPWGTHLCQFYQDQQDLVDILVPYFKAGLENNELCMWVTSEPLRADEAKAALARDVRNLDHYLDKGQIEILDYSQWYTVGGKFDADCVLRGWVEKEEAAKRRGFDGLRLTGNTFWLEKSDWQGFTDYEATVDSVIGRYRMLAICTYSLAKCGAVEIMDVVANHAFALIKRAGRWQVIESAERKRIEASLREAEERYTELFESMDEGFALCEMIYDESGAPADFRYLRVNRAFAELTGFPCEQVVGRTVRELIPGIEPFWIETYGRIVRTGQSERIENPVATLGKHYEVHAWRSGDRRFSAVFSDVTERKRVEREREITVEFLKRADQELRAANSELSAVHSNAPMVFLVVDEDLRVRKANDAATQFAGRTRPEMIGVRPGNAIGCLNALDDPRGCGHGAACGDCPIRSATLDSLQNETRHDNVEAWLPFSVDGRTQRRCLLVSTAPLHLPDARKALVCALDITDRKQAEEALRRQAALIDLSPDGNIVRKLDGTISFWSGGAEKLYGWAKEEAIGQRTHDLLQTAFPEPVDRVLAQLRLTGQWSGEMVQRTRDGCKIVVESWWQAQRDEHGDIKELLESNVDVTARKQEGEKLRQLNRTLRAHSRSDQALFHAADEAAYLQDVCKIVVEDCGHAMVWVGFAEDDEAKTVRAVAHYGFEQGYLETLKVTWADTERGRGPTGTAIRTGRVAVCRDMLTDPAFLPWREQAIRRGYASSIVLPLMSGHKAFGALTIYSREPDPFSDDEVTLLSELASDLAYGINVLRLRAAHARAEQSLRESEERFRLIADTMANLVWTARPDGVVDYVNRHFQDYTGDLPGDGGDWNLSPVHPDDRPATEAAWQKAVRTGAAYETEHRIRRFDGIYRWHLSRGVPVWDSQGRVVKWYCTATDVHEIREAQEQLHQTADELRRSNEDLEQFAYVSSHDLQEPLRMVTGFVQLLQKEYGGKLDPAADEYIQFTVDGARRMRRLIDDLLAYSRAGTKAREFVPTDSGQALSAAVSNLRVNIEENKAQILFGQLPTVRADGLQLVQVFQNLIGNAIKFRGGDAPKVWVDARRDGDLWLFSVKDNGIGIDPRFHEKIFMIFQRLHSRDEYPGTGIGLAVCKKIVERHGGRIWVESTPGQGSTFFFTVPE